jgi:hypothetical protein
MGTSDTSETHNQTLSAWAASLEATEAVPGGRVKFPHLALDGVTGDLVRPPQLASGVSRASQSDLS